MPAGTSYRFKSGIDWKPTALQPGGAVWANFTDLRFGGTSFLWKVFPGTADGACPTRSTKSMTTVTTNSGGRMCYPAIGEGEFIYPYSGNQYVIFTYPPGSSLAGSGFGSTDWALSLVNSARVG